LWHTVYSTVFSHIYPAYTYHMSRSLKVLAALESSLTASWLSAHVEALCWAGYYQLWQLRPVVQSMTVEAARTVAAVFISSHLDYLLPYGLPGHSVVEAAVCSEHHRTIDHWHVTCMPGSSVAVRAGTCLPGRWLLPRVWQHSALSAVGWHSDLRCTTNIQQLWRQNFCSCGTLFMELYRSSCAIQTSPTDCLDDSWRDTVLGTMDTCSVTFDM